MALPVRWWVLWGVCALGCGWPQAKAQVFTERFVLASGDSLKLPRNNLVPFSELVEAAGQTVPASTYRLDYFNGVLYAGAGFPADTVELLYRTFPQAAEPVVALRPDSLRDTLTPQPRYEVAQAPRSGPSSSVAMGNLQSSGSLSRSITVGSNRDLAVNSDFQLQLNGELADDLTITAAITDQNIPIQPSGTTQQIADFDQVFIQLQRGRSKLTCGDFEIQQQNTAFANIYRNVLGVNYQHDRPDLGGQLSFNVSKGRFATNSFMGENGRQGPYRLTGNNNEQFIIILAGSERVYINGRQVQRGERFDYIIEYNTGELTFTSNRLITTNDRIVVDFEYADRNYARSLLFAHGRVEVGQNDRFKLQVSYGREADNPNSPIDLELGDAEREAAQAAGDDATGVFVSGIDTVPYDEAAILYASLDTTVNGITYPDVLVYSTDSLLAQFQVSFTNVGIGNGNYVRDQSLVNGNLFRWVAPLADGTPAGDYEPVRVIPLPTSLQVANVVSSYQLTRHLSLQNETSVSQRDQNRLSSRDDSDNDDIASRMSLLIKGLPLAGNWTVGGNLSGQYVGARYLNFDRVYEKEYGREWDYDDLGARAIERLGEAGVSLQNGTRYRMGADVGLRTYGDSLTTLRQRYRFASQDTGRLMGEYELVILNTEDDGLMRTSEWVRQNGDLYTLQFGWLKPGVELWLENRRERESEDLRAGSFSFQDLTPYLAVVGLEGFGMRLAYNYRFDQAFLAGELRNKSINQSPQLEATTTPVKGLRVNAKASLQRFRVLDSLFSSQENLLDANNFVGNLQADYRTTNRFLRLNGLYEVLAEQVARRQEVYVEVNPGQGQYEWVDYDDDGIQDLDEFQLSANPLIADFVKVLSPTQELFPAVTIRNGLNGQLDFARLMPDSGAVWQRVLSRMSTVSNLRLEQKRATEPGEPQQYTLDLSALQAPDSTVLNALFNLKQDLFFFRNHPKGEFSFGWLELQQRQFLSAGFEERRSRTGIARQRYSLSRSKTLENSFRVGFSRNQAENLPNRAYDVQFVSASPSFNVQLNRFVRLSGGYGFTWKENREPTGGVNSTLQQHKLSVDGRFNLGGRNNLFAKTELFRINQLGEANTLANFELLEGNQPGVNATWSLFFTYFVTKSLELSVVYEARANEGRPTLHSGRVQLRALF